MLTATNSFSLILFGASGNLAQLKLYPALFTLARRKRLPKDYLIVGYARTAFDDDAFRSFVAASIRREMPEAKEGALREFQSHLHYVTGAYDSDEDLRRLAKRVGDIDGRWESKVRLAYLSVPPQVIPGIVERLCGSGLRGEGEFRCIVEKPVGRDRASFEEIEALLTRCLQENDIYLLDHYLGKEAVRNVYYLRFANPILERLLKNTLIRDVEISATETVGIEGRAGYFEHTGAFRDMFQSHLLLMMALLTMRLRDTDALIPSGRLLALKDIYLPPARTLDEIALQGQYEAGTAGEEPVKGYREEEGVPPHSRTNTFAAVRLLTRAPRWQGVPFRLRSGKRLAKKETRIAITFQEPRITGKGSGPNRLELILQGEAGMRIHLQTKVGGAEPAFRPLVLTDPLVCVGDCLPEHGLLLLEAIAGRKIWFLSPEEVRAAWTLTDPLQSHFDHPDTPLHLYPAGSAGPKIEEGWGVEEDAYPTTATASTYEDRDDTGR